MIARDQLVDPNLIVIETNVLIPGKGRGPAVTIGQVPPGMQLVECAIEANPEQLLEISTKLRRFAMMKRGFET